MPPESAFMFLFLIVTVGAVSVLFGGLEEDEISETLRNVADNDQRGNSRDDQQHALTCTRDSACSSRG